MEYSRVNFPYAYRFSLARTDQIEKGSYTIIGYVEVLKDKQPYYQMILEQEGEARLYTLPKDMVDMVQSDAISGRLEVVEKSGLRKAILYPKKVNP